MVATILVEVLALASRFLYAAPRSEEAEHVQRRMASQWFCGGYRDCLLQTIEEVIETARLRRVSLSIRLRGRAPDSYRLKDASGNVIGVYSIDGKIDAHRS